MIHIGDCLEVMKGMEAGTVDAVVTDPPYGWRFMGKSWDGDDIEKMAAKAVGKEPRLCADGKMRKPRENCKSIAAGKYDLSLTGNQAFQVFTEEWAREAFRILKPGGHMLVFCGPRTYHRMAAGVEDAGFEIRDQLQWLFGQGFPKSHNLPGGIGTALKPANEPIVLARKPLKKGLTVAANVLKHGTGALNIDASRIGDNAGWSYPNGPGGAKINGGNLIGSNNERRTDPTHSTQGRWPANVLFDEDAAAVLDEQSGILKSGGGDKSSDKLGYHGGAKGCGPKVTEPSSGGASRFFYVAKSSKKDRNSNGAVNNVHPTCKPTKLMEYLIRMVTPPGGVVLDPFMGSGTTGVAARKLGFRFIGIEREPQYAEIAEKRIAAVGKVEAEEPVEEQMEFSA